MAPSRGDDSDDFEDEPYDRGRVPFPGVVKAAGVIWIGVGSLSLINMMATFALAGQNPGAANPASGCCPGLIGLAFLVCGYQTVTGKATDTLGNGVGSMVLGLLQLGIAALVGLGGALLGQNGGAQAPQALPPVVFLVIAGFVGVLGATLVLAGVLALSGRSAYREWRRENAPQRARRPRRRDERDEPDERPWKRGRDEGE
jgi:hypothetical protein